MNIIHLGKPENWLEEQFHQTLESNLELQIKSPQPRKQKNKQPGKEQNLTQDVAVLYSGSRKKYWQELQDYYYQGYCILVLFPPLKIPMKISELQQCEFEPGDVLFAQKGLKQKNQKNLAWKKKIISLKHLKLATDENIETINDHTEIVIDSDSKNIKDNSQEMLIDVGLKLYEFLQASCETLDQVPPSDAGYMTVSSENLLLTKSLSAPQWSTFNFNQTPSIEISTTVHVLLEADRDDTSIHSDFILLVSDRIKLSAHTGGIMPGNDAGKGRMYFITRVTRDIELNKQTNIMEVKCVSGSPERDKDHFSSYETRSLLVHQHSAGGCIGISFTAGKRQQQTHNNWKAESKTTNAFSNGAPGHSANTKFYMTEPFDIEKNPWSDWSNWFRDKIFEGNYKFRPMTDTSTEKNLILNSQSIWHVKRQLQDAPSFDQPISTIAVPGSITLKSSIGLEIGGYGWKKGTNTVKALKNSSPYTKSSDILINFDDERLKPRC